MRSGEILRSARMSRGLSQRELSAVVGTPQSVIARYESGKVEPSLEQLSRLLERAGLDLKITIEPRRLRGHDLHARRSLAYHRLIADRLRTEPLLLARARRRVQEWKTGTRPFAGSPEYIHAWELLLAQPLGNVVEEITSESSQAAELRQNSPFNGLLGQAIWEELVAEIKEDARAASS